MTEHEFYTAIKGLAKGNKDMLHAIYDAYGRLIYTIVYDILKNREDAEDVTSEFFIKLIRVAGTYQKKTSHRAWLIRIARNMAIDLLRKRGHEYLLHETEDAPQDQLEEGGTVETTSTVEEHVVLAEDMRQAIQTLSDREREVLDLKLVGDLKFREIAKTLGQPLGTVTWLYNQGIKKLRRCLREYGTTE